MRVLHVIARMNVGGTATYLLNLLKGLEAAGIQTLLAVGSVPGNEREDLRLEQIKYRKIKGLSRDISPIRDLRARRDIWELINEYQPDLIHCHTFKAGLLVRSKKSPIPVVHTFHGHHLYDPDYGKFAKVVLNLIERNLAKRCKKIITIGSKVGEELLEVGIGRSEQYLSIAPGIESPKLSDRIEILNEFDLREKALKVLWMGRLTYVKRPDRVVELARRYPKVDFVVAGDGELKEDLLASAPSNLHLVGVQSSDEMFSIADIVLLTSDSEGMPLTLIEGQMAGVAALATGVGSTSEIIDNGITGIITTTDLDQISIDLGKLIDDSMLRSTMGKKAKVRALSLFSIENMVSRHIKAYNEVVG
jgi:glycosyltransferase involved in cell wall biosynthesis